MPRVFRPHCSPLLNSRRKPARQGTVAAAKDTSSYADLLPAVLSVVALSVFGVAFFVRAGGGQQSTCSAEFKKLECSRTPSTFQRC